MLKLQVNWDAFFTPECVPITNAADLDRPRAREEQWRRATASEARTRSTSQARDESVALDRRIRYDARRVRGRARHSAHASRQAVPRRNPAKPFASSRDRETDARCRSGSRVGRGSRLPGLRLPCPIPSPKKQKMSSRSGLWVVGNPQGCPSGWGQASRPSSCADGLSPSAPIHRPRVVRARPRRTAPVGQHWLLVSAFAESLRRCAP